MAEQALKMFIGAGLADSIEFTFAWNISPDCRHFLCNTMPVNLLGGDIRSLLPDVHYVFTSGQRTAQELEDGIIHRKLPLNDRMLCYSRKAYVKINVECLHIAGSPFIDFSNIGLRRMWSGTSALLFFVWVRTVQIHLPRIIIFEMCLHSMLPS